LARLKPTSAGQITAPPSPAGRPNFTWGSAILACSAAIVMSQNSAIVAPRPMAAPLTLAMIGFGQSRMAWTSFLPFSNSARNSFGSSIISWIAEASPPAQKALPAPVRTTTRVVVSAAAISNSA